MLVRAALFLALFAVGKTQSVACPPLDPIHLTHKPLSIINGLQCQWVVTVDQNGCQRVVQQCSGRPYHCKNEGEVLWQCSTCEPSCGNPNPTCGNLCGPPLCQCAPGMVRDKLSGSCIPQAKCGITQLTPPERPSCKFGEVLVRQNCSRLTCERQCEGPPNCNQLCNQLLCICADGYFRASNGECLKQCNPPPPSPCRTDIDCIGDSNICGSSGFCTQGRLSDQNYTESQICGFRGCGVPACASDLECYFGKICIENQCKRGCRTWSECPANTGCIDNTCKAVAHHPNFCQTDAHCPGAGRICVGNRCATGCRVFTDCPKSTVCVSGTCHRVLDGPVASWPSSCLTDNQCGNDNICVGNQCQKRCRSDNNCPIAQRCFNSLCVVVDPPPLCRNNFDCSFGNNCIGGLCRSGASFA